MQAGSCFAGERTVKVIRSFVSALTGKAEKEKPWEFAPLVVEKEIPPDDPRAVEQAKQIRLGYSVEICNKGEGVRYTEGLRIVEAKIAWDAGARLILNTMLRWSKPEPRDLTLAEFTRILTRIGEYLTCDGKALTVVDQSPPLRIDDLVVAKVVLPRVSCWTRLERDYEIVEDRAQQAAATAQA